MTVKTSEFHIPPLFYISSIRFKSIGQLLYPLKMNTAVHIHSFKEQSRRPTFLLQNVARREGCPSLIVGLSPTNRNIFLGFLGVQKHLSYFP